MSEISRGIFITGQSLVSAIEAQTGEPARRFERRDFVGPLVEFCNDGNYCARIGDGWEFEEPGFVWKRNPRY